MQLTRQDKAEFWTPWNCDI